MKKLFSLFVSILVSTVLYSQETVHPQVVDSSAFKPKMTEAEMLVSLQRQMTEIQLQINQIQYSLSDKSKESKALIPIEEQKHKSRFYWSARASFLLTSSQYSDTQGSDKNLGLKVSYAVKPAFGYIFSDRLTVGTTIVFADCRFADLSLNSFQYILANAMIGGGFSLSDYITWSIQPYVRYRFCHIIWKRLNLWGEFSVYAGQKIPRDPKTAQIQSWNSSTIYGAKLRPMLTVDLNKDLMLFTAMELLSWEGSCKVYNKETLVNNNVSFTIIPIYSILSGLFNIGIIKKF